MYGKNNIDWAGRVLIGIEDVQLSDLDRQHLAHPATGGVVLFTRNFSSRQQVTALVRDIRSASNMDLLITVDHEGGRVQRFREGFTRLPALAVLGRVYEEFPERALDLAYRHGRVMATEVLLCGIDMSFAPVLDLDGPSVVIGDRSFSPIPEVVSVLAGHYLAGMHDAGMKTCGKHYPGHGSTVADSHVDHVNDPRSAAEIDALDVFPFRHHAGDLDSVMMAHVVYPDVDDKPAGYSSRWINDHLREQLGFEGIVMSDDLGMHAAGYAGKLLDRMVLSFEAGCDAVLVCKPVEVAQLYEGLDAGAVTPGSPLSVLRGTCAHNEEELATVSEWRHWQQSLISLEKSKWA